MKTASILTIGNEVLNGTTLDSNSNWICRQIVGRGAKVTRICVVPDEHEAIVEELRWQLRKAPRLIVTLGGLGPTADDLTLRAVADSLGLPVVQDKRALEIVQERYRDLERQGVVGAADSPDAVAAREKMSFIPRGSMPIFNPIGAAPAVVTRDGGCIILSLPGVPREVKAIVLQYAADAFHASIGTGYFRNRVLSTDCNDESRLALPASIVAEKFPGVYFKTRPIRGSDNSEIGITLSLGGDHLEDVEEELDRAFANLSKELRSHGITVTGVTEEL